MDVIAILEGKGIDYVVRGGGEISIHCPNAINHQDGTDSVESFNINVDELKGGCFACGLAMNTAKLTKWLLGEDLDDLEYKCLELRGRLKKLENEVDISLPLPVSQSVVMPFGRPVTEPYRGIGVETYKKLNAMIVERGRYADRLVMPVVVHNRIIGLDGRALSSDTQPKYLRNANSSCSYDWLYPYDLVKASRPSYVILGEGIFHAINGFDKGFPVLCYFGVNNWSTNKVIMLMELGVTEVILFPDKDKAGFEAVYGVYEEGRKEKHGIGETLVDWFDVSVANTDNLPLDPLATLAKGVAVYQDLGDLSREEIQWAIDNRRKF